MAKKIKSVLKLLSLRAGAANPAPPLGPTLGQAGVNIMEFCKQYNDMTQDKKGQVVPALLTVYEDRSFKIELKIAPVGAMILAALKKDKGSGEASKTVLGTLTREQVREIAEKKLPDLNTNKIESAMQMVIGTARSMGVAVEEAA